jgi:polysaccharide pyruvyl transferase CsaB
VNVLISGYYGFGNLGDEALLSGLLSGLKGHEVTVLSRTPAATRKFHGVAAAHRYYQAVPALLRADVLISGGGGLLQDTTSRRSLNYYLGLMRVALRLGKRVIVYGQSVGPLSEKGAAEVASILRHCVVAVRDEPSRQLLARHGVTAALVADSALVLPPANVPGAAAQSVVLIPRAGYPAITQALASAGQALSDYPLAALALHPHEDANEVAQLKAALPKLTVLEAASPAQVSAQLASTHYVISGRLHGLILAAVVGIPYAGIVYDPKVQAFLTATAAPVFTLPVDVPALIECVRLAQGPEPAAVTELKEQAQAGLDWLEQQLNHRPPGGGEDHI